MTASSFDWRQVPLDRYGKERFGHWARGRTFVSWRAEEPSAGITATAPQSPAALDETWRLFDRAFARGGEPISLSL